MQLKNYLLTFLSVLLALFVFSKISSISLNVNSVTTNKSDALSVSGKGKVSVKPDIAVLNAGVESQDTTVALVQDKINKSTNSIINALKKLGIEEKDIKTTQYSINPVYNAVPVVQSLEIKGIPQQIAPQTQKITSYNATTTIQVTVRKMDQVNNIIDTLTNSGANIVNGVSFTVDKPEKYEDEARQIAINDAKAKAQKIASQAGFKLGKILNVYENSFVPGRGVMYSAAATKAADNTETNIQTGETEVTVNITLNFETK